MPGTVVLKPLSAKLTRNTEFFGKMDPYCKVKLGKQKVESQVCRNGGKHPHWEDTLVLKRNNEPTCHLELKEKDWLLPDDLIGSCDINLAEIEAQQRVLRWYPMAFHNKPVGSILLEISYQPEGGVQPSNKIGAPVPPSNQIKIEPVPIQQQQNIPVPQEYQPQPQPQPQIHLQPQFQNQPPIQNPVDQTYYNKYPQRPHHGIQAPYQNYPQPNLAGPVEQIGDKYPNLVQETLYAPSYGNWQQDNNYPQKYPQFGQNNTDFGATNQCCGYPNK